MTEDPRAQASDIYFDGGCPLCRREVSLYRRRLRGAEGARWRDLSCEAPPEGLTREAALARLHVRRRDGAMVSGFRAFIAIWRLDPRLAPLARTLDRAPFAMLGEAAYRLFLRVRFLWRRR